MDFDLTPEQREIKDVARELLAARSPWPKVRDAAEAGRYDEALWEELVGLGWGRSSSRSCSRSWATRARRRRS